MKTVSPDLYAAIMARSCRTVYLAEIDHPTGVVRLNSGVLPVTWGGNTFVALGKMGAVQGMAQSMDGRSQEVTLLMAAPALDDDAQDIVSQPVSGRTAKVWQAFLNDDWTVIGSPIVMADITMDGLEVTADEGGMQVLSIKGYMTQYAARRVMPVFYSNESQQAEFPGDTGFDRMAGLADKIV